MPTPHRPPAAARKPHRQAAASAGVALILGLIAMLGARAAAAGFPGIADGEVPLWGLRPDGHLPEAFSVLAYAFYMQPMLVVLAREMPAGWVPWVGRVRGQQAVQGAGGDETG
jgi:hypothetical protein